MGKQEDLLEYYYAEYNRTEDILNQIAYTSPGKYPEDAHETP
jgi:hypothetical protein